jgi:hypothetical protein
VVTDVARLGELDIEQARVLLRRFGLRLRVIDDALPIPGSYWGDDEAGLIGDCVYVRSDTPAHSLLHEACHWITCSPQRRAAIHTDAADNQAEENATCYLQILLADELQGFGRVRALADMDTWGYSFRLGSAERWFLQDATAERQWLIDFGLLDAEQRVLFCCRNIETVAANKLSVDSFAKANKNVS